MIDYLRISLVKITVSLIEVSVVSAELSLAVVSPGVTAAAALG